MPSLHFKKISFYLKSFYNLLIGYFRNKNYYDCNFLLSKRPDLIEIEQRVEYYCNIKEPFTTDADSLCYKTLNPLVLPSIPSLDLKVALQSFAPDLRFYCDFRDNLRNLRWIPRKPTFVKCRPIDCENNNSVLLKLNSVRFFDFQKDHLDFARKKPVAVFRGPCHREHRQEFVNRCHRIPHTNIGDTRKCQIGKPTFKSFLSQREQLQNKFIISVEGNDVSSSLTWIMASNSLAFMTLPKFEGWFMQGRLIPNHHYVLLRDDYSDLSEKIDYFARHTDEAIFIINNANNHVAKFFDSETENIVTWLVIRKYFAYSGQLK